MEVQVEVTIAEKAAAMTANHLVRHEEIWHATRSFHGKSIRLLLYWVQFQEQSDEIAASKERRFLCLLL